MRRIWTKVALAVALLALLGCDTEEQRDATSDVGAATVGGTLSGLVTGTDGATLPGAEISTEPATSVAVSRADGGYLMEGLPAGTYTVRVVRPDYEDATKDGVVITSAGTMLLDFTLVPEDQGEVPLTGAIEGTVTDAATSTAVAGATVTLAPEGRASVTAADGTFAFDNVAPGTVSLTVSAESYLTPDATTVVVTAGATATVTLTLEAEPEELLPGTLQGTVTSGGAALMGVAITTTPAVAETLTTSDGTWSLSVPAGTYVVHAALAGYESAESNAQVEEGTTVTVDLSLAVAYDSTCTSCHVSESRLLDDLADDPLPAPPGEGGSAGEG